MKSLTNYFFTLLFVLLTGSLTAQSFMPVNIGMIRPKVYENLKITRYANDTLFNFNDKSPYMRVKYTLNNYPGIMSLKFKGDSLIYYYYQFSSNEITRANFTNFLDLFREIKTRIVEKDGFPLKCAKLDTTYRDPVKTGRGEYEPAHCKWKIKKQSLELTFMVGTKTGATTKKYEFIFGILGERIYETQELPY
jgi:hypothetical protein